MYKPPADHINLLSCLFGIYQSIDIIILI